MMKILKTNTDVLNANKEREIANVGCGKCPCCGEEENIFSFQVRTERCKGIFSPLIFANVDTYTCNVCGAKWESELYSVLK